MKKAALALPYQAHMGGACPIDEYEHSDVVLLMRSGDVENISAQNARKLSWSHKNNADDILGWAYRGDFVTKPTAYTTPTIQATNTSIELLDKAAKLQRERAATYDQPEGERSMSATVTAFNAITRRSGEFALTESEGFLLLQILKDVRDRSTDKPHVDSIEDCISYAALKGEARLREAT